MDIIVIWTFIKWHKMYLFLTATSIYFLGLSIYLIAKDVFGVNKFIRDFKKVFKPIKKKQRKNIEIPTEEIINVLADITKLQFMYEKTIISLNNAQGLKERKREKLLEVINKEYKKFETFEEYIKKYYAQKRVLENIEPLAVRTAEKMPIEDDIWK